jgi:transcriptional regulator with XRE-family HTH domain
VSSRAPKQARVIVLRPVRSAAPAAKEPLWRDVVGDVLRRERLAQERTLQDVADAARISMPYLSEVERGRKEASSEVLAAAARALGLRLADLLALAHGELARLAGPAHSAGAAGPRADEDRAATSSVAELATRRAPARPGHGAGEVRLAA